MDTESALKKAAAERILSRRDSLLREQGEVRQEQARLAARDRELERSLSECRAAARFFGIPFDPLEDDPEVNEMRERARLYRMRAEEHRIRRHPDAPLFARRADEYESRVHLLVEQKMGAAAQEPQQASAPDDPDPGNQQPKVRDAVLERLREMSPNGEKAAQLRRYLETSYLLNLHEKTVGMTLYRLSKDGLVHRKGQTWFYGPRAESLLPASSENPGAGGTGA